MSPTATSAEPRRQIAIERRFRATPDAIWELWTTKDGIESWWGPPGFSVKVRSLDLRTGGQLDYTMSASTPETVAFMNRAGMPVTTEHLVTYTDVVPLRRLAWMHPVDFVPGVPTYDTASALELREDGDGVRLVLTIDAMHDDVWTQRAVMGWQGELGKLAAVLGEAP